MAVVKDPLRYKTKACANWAANRSCPYGHRCQFAHGEVERRALPSPSLPAAQMHLARRPQPAGVWQRGQAAAMCAPPDPMHGVGFARTPQVTPECSRRSSAHEHQHGAAATFPSTSPWANADKNGAACSSTGESVGWELATPLTLGQICMQTPKADLERRELSSELEPGIYRREVSFPTQLVRRAVSFLFEDAGEGLVTGPLGDPLCTGA